MIGKLFFDKSGDALQKCVTYIDKVDGTTEIHLSTRNNFTNEQLGAAFDYCAGRGVKLVISRYIAPHNIFVVKEIDASKSIFEKTSGQDSVL